MKVNANVKLINYTNDADSILVFSKKTRLGMTLENYDEVRDMSDFDKKRELEYVFGTVGSSWEFVDYIFLISMVSRGYTHQLVRHRHGSYAQQSQRTVDIGEDFGYISSGLCESDAQISKEYNEIMELIGKKYASWIRRGVSVEDARGILPTNVSTNILVKFNLRSLSDMIGERLCIRSQGEFRRIVELMKQEIINVHPWVEEILLPKCVRTGYCQWHNFKDCPMKINGYIKNPDIEFLKDKWEELMEF